MSNHISNEALLEDLERVIEKLGHAPFLNEYTEHGEYHGNTLSNRFGSWVDALEKVGETYPKGNDGEGRFRKVSNEKLIEDIKQVGEKLGHCPTSLEYGEHGAYSQSLPSKRFGSWVNACRSANYAIRRSDKKVDYPKRISEAELIDDVLAGSFTLGHPITQAEYRTFSEHAPGTLIKRFGVDDWEDVLEYVGLEEGDGEEECFDKYINRETEVADAD